MVVYQRCSNISNEVERRLARSMQSLQTEGYPNRGTQMITASSSTGGLHNNMSAKHTKVTAFQPSLQTWLEWKESQLKELRP